MSPHVTSASFGASGSTCSSEPFSVGEWLQPTYLPFALSPPGKKQMPGNIDSHLNQQGKINIIHFSKRMVTTVQLGGYEHVWFGWGYNLFQV